MQVWERITLEPRSRKATSKEQRLVPLETLELNPYSLWLGAFKCAPIWVVPRNNFRPCHVTGTFFLEEIK